MKIKLNKPLKLDVILENLKLITIINGDEISFNAFKLIELESILLSHISFPENLSSISKTSILNKTLREVVRQNYCPESFIKILSSELKKHNSKIEQNYYILCSLSIDYLPFNKVLINNSEISFLRKNYPKIFSKPRKDIFKKMNFLEQENHEGYLKVIIKTRGKSYTDTFEESMNNLDVFRGILSLILNPTLQIPYGTARHEPINKIRLGHFYSIHLENGENVNDHSYWYQPDFFQKTFTFKLENKTNIKRQVNWFLKKLNSSKIKNEICNSLQLYVNAFDEKNRQSCFLKSWTALEKLLDTNMNEVIIKRCLAIYSKDAIPLQQQVLEGLKKIRNEFIHDGSKVDDNISVHCFQVQRMIYHLLRFNHLRFPHLFNNIQDAAKFLDKRKIDEMTLLKESKMLNEISKINRTKC